MAGKTSTLTVQVVADATDAQRGLDGAAEAVESLAKSAGRASGPLDDATRAVKDYGDAADTASRASGAVSDGVETVGDSSGRAGAGIRDLAGALEGTQFEAFGQAAADASVYLDAGAGAADLYRSGIDLLGLANIKETASTVASTAARIANTVATNAANVATKAWAVAQGILNAVLAANPIGLVVIAVVALVAAIVLAYKNSETFRNIVQAVMKAVGAAIGAVVDVLAVVGEWIGDLLVGYLHTLQTVWKAVFDAVMVPIKAVRDGIGWIIEKIQALIGWLGKIKLPDVGGFVDAINPFTAPPAPAVAGYMAAPWPAARGTRAGSGGTRQGAPVQVIVQVPPTANPVEVGREVVATIRAFERAAGKTWRTS